MTPEPISREAIAQRHARDEAAEEWIKREVWSAALDQAHEDRGRLLAALDAGEALARTLTENVHWCECWDEYQRPLPQCDRCKALAGWRAIVEGKDDAPKANQS